MRKSSVEAILEALNQASVRYLVAGGLAVVAHGHLRTTVDLDLILDLDTGNVNRALSCQFWGFVRAHRCRWSSLPIGHCGNDGSPKKD